ncbi:MAG: HAD family phosphatase [Candidatus Cloacimonetes bacterium]|nr:HAD family phosphatase [Candidatus Cloacimonadota bacterium]
MNKIYGVIFDLDGTLIDSMGVWTQVDEEYLSKRNIEVPENLFLDIEEGNSFIEVARYFKQKFALKDSIEEIIDEWTYLVSDHYENDIKLKPGVREFLQLLKEHNVKIGVGTSNTLFLTTKVLKSNGIFEYFDSIVTGCRDIKGKPYPDIFLKVAEELKVNPENCLVCEDVLAGIQAGKNAGMHVVAVYDACSEPEKQTINELADYYGSDFYQIIEYCLQNNLLE